MSRIRPHLWYDTQAKEAAEYYAATFPDSRVTSIVTLRDTPGGDTDVVSFELFGQAFQAISAGPHFTFTPAISFLVSCTSKEEVEAYWQRLGDGGSALMPLEAYDFSELYGWTQDRFGLSWQVMYLGDEPGPQRITPTLLFTGEVYGKAEQALRAYAGIFGRAQLGELHHYGPDEAPNDVGTLKFGSVVLDGQVLAAMDGGGQHEFTFNEAVSLIVDCQSQDEIDRYWNALSAVPEAEQCGWLKDTFGVSWQIVPAELDDLLSGGTDEQVARVTQAFLPMKKLDIAELRKAYEG